MPADAADVPDPPSRGLPGVVGAHAGAPAPARAGRLRHPSRTCRWGDLADLVLLDGRQYRSDQACGSPTLSLDPACPEASDPARTMLGAEQEQWLGETARRVDGDVARGRPADRADGPRAYGDAILNYDQWDGYAPARDRLLAQAAASERAVVLTGDIHLAGVGRLPGVGVEFVTASISSHGHVDPALQPILDHVRRRRGVRARSTAGYTRHTVTPTTWTAEYRIVDDVADPAARRCRRGGRSGSMPRPATSSSTLDAERDRARLHRCARSSRSSNCPTTYELPALDTAGRRRAVGTPVVHDLTPLLRHSRPAAGRQRRGVAPPRTAATTTAGT